MIIFLLSWRNKHSQHAFKVFYHTAPENAKKLGQLDPSSMFLIAWAPFRRDSIKVTPREERSCWAAFGSCWASGGREGWRDHRVQRSARMEQKHSCGWTESHISGNRHKDFAKDWKGPCLTAPKPLHWLPARTLYRKTIGRLWINILISLLTDFTLLFFMLALVNI